MGKDEYFEEKEGWKRVLIIGGRRRGLFLKKGGWIGEMVENKVKGNGGMEGRKAEGERWIW